MGRNGKWKTSIYVENGENISPKCYKCSLFCKYLIFPSHPGPSPPISTQDWIGYVGWPIWNIKGKIGASYFAPPCSQSYDRREEGTSYKLLSAQRRIGTRTRLRMTQQPKYLHTTIKNGFDFFLLMILQQNYLRVNPVRVWAQAWVESVLWFEDIIVLGLRVEQGTCDYNCHCYFVTGYHTTLYDTTTYQVTLYTLLICWLWLRGCVRWTLNMLRLWSKQIKFLQHFSHMIWWWNSIIKDITHNGMTGAVMM